MTIRELRYEKVDVEVYGFNDGSLAFHDALRFVREGVRRGSYYTRGSRHDVVQLGLTADEFEGTVARRLT